MKRSLRLCSLVGALAVTSWLSVHSNAGAYPATPCDLVNGMSCSGQPLGGKRTCYNRVTFQLGTCVCTGFEGGPPPVWSC
jgi:hypothetical protein